MIFDTGKQYILENDRVKLIPLEVEHIAHLLTYSIHEPNLWEFSLIPANRKENLENYVSIALKKRAEGDSYPFIVYDKKFAQYAGSTRFYDIQRYHRTLQLGYTWYGQKFQRTGLNKNCKYLLLEFAFEKLNAERVEFRADAKNERSIHAMKSIGCTPEGILRSNCTSPSGRRDSIVLSILKDEWYSEIKSMLHAKLKQHN